MHPFLAAAVHASVPSCASSCIRSLLRQFMHLFLAAAVHAAITKCGSSCAYCTPCCDNPEPVFVNLLRSPGIDSQPGGPVRQPCLLYRPAKLNRLAESISRNRFPGSLNVYKYGLRVTSCHTAGPPFCLNSRYHSKTQVFPCIAGNIGNKRSNTVCKRTSLNKGEVPPRDTY
jgi:hypothetical protein